MKYNTLILGKRWFTLVELIVVITIVWILSTIWFVSYSGYLTSARDSNRLSQLTKLSDSLQTYAASKSLPLPDDYREISSSWSRIAYQGVAGVDVLETIDYTNGWKDPKDDDYYIYAISSDRKKIQLLTFLEDSVAILPWTTQSYAADYIDRFPASYGSKIGIILQESDYTPINLLSDSVWDQPIEDITQEMRVYFKTDYAVTGTWAQIERAIAYNQADFSNPVVLDEWEYICNPDRPVEWFVVDLINSSKDYINLNIDAGTAGILVDNSISYGISGIDYSNSEFSWRLFFRCTMNDEFGNIRFDVIESDWNIKTISAAAR